MSSRILRSVPCAIYIIMRLYEYDDAAPTKYMHAIIMMLVYMSCVSQFPEVVPSMSAVTITETREAAVTVATEDRSTNITTNTVAALLRRKAYFNSLPKVFMGAFTPFAAIPFEVLLRSSS